MKPNAAVAFISILLCPLAICAPSSADPGTGTQAYRLQQVEANAAAASANAHIYQWRRVTIEVNRIATDEHALETAGVSGNPSEVSMLHEAVLDLRTARRDRNVADIQEAAGQVIAVCNALMAQPGTE